MRHLYSSNIKVLTLRARNYFVVTIFLIYAFGTSSYATEDSIISIAPGDYAIKTELLLPHLEDNLHYTTTHTRQCLGLQGASTLFPILTQVSFVDCVLVGKQPDTNAFFDLVCANAEAATGSARFFINEKSVRATLQIKMGGKNMKFSQRIQGRRMGAC